MTVTARREELAHNLAKVRTRVAAACARAGRDPKHVHLVAVTKTYPVSDIEHLLALGVTDIGENRDQEAREKASALAQASPRPRWHFIGQLQRNKVRSVARYADVVHSVDRRELVHALDRAATTIDKQLEVLIQVNLDPDSAPGRGGVEPADVADLAAVVAASDSLQLRGVMGVAPLNKQAQPAFKVLATIAADIKDTYPDAGWISAGMSGDLEEAIENGATHLRIGGGLLGNRRRPGVG